MHARVMQRQKQQTGRSLGHTRATSSSRRFSVSRSSCTSRVNCLITCPSCCTRLCKDCTMRSARASRPLVDPTLIVAQKSAEPISAMVLGIWTLSRLLTVEGEERALLCDESAEARTGVALRD